MTASFYIIPGVIYLPQMNVEIVLEYMEKK